VKDPSNVFKTLKFYCVNALQDIHEEMFKFFEQITEFFMQKNDLQINVLYEILVSGREKIDTFLTRENRQPVASH
jgi:hypothetical protein